MLRTPTGIPRPRSTSTDINSQHLQLSSSCSEGTNDLARKRQAKKDETIRKKLEQELSRQTGRKVDKSPPRSNGTVGSLRPLPAITLSETATASEAARHMAVKRADAVLVTDEDDQLTGIVTDKDLAFRVLAEGQDPRTTCLGDIMTRDPCTVTTSHNATDALNRMVAGGFRHLPVTDSNSEDIIGMLDITECLLDALAKLERAQKSSKQLSEVLDTMSEFENVHNKDVTTYVKVLREQLGFPTLSSITLSKAPSEVSIRTNVRDAARVMKERHQTATLVVDEGKTVGIFTSKDIVVRVMAMGLDPTMTSTVRVMTPSPDMASPDMTILDALRKMHGGHYQHLPLLDQNTSVVGVVDIIQLTYTTLNTLKSMQLQEADGPVWNKFWNAVTMEENNSDSLSDHRTNHNGSLSIENPSIRNPSTGATSPSSTVDIAVPELNRRFSTASKLDDDTFTFKFTDPSSSQTHRFNAPCKDLEDFLSAIRGKICMDLPFDLTISYIDDENDKIVLSSDDDLQTAVSAARKAQSNLIRLVAELQPQSYPSEELVPDIPESPVSPTSPNPRSPRSLQSPSPTTHTPGTTIHPHPPQLHTKNSTLTELLAVSGGSFALGLAIGATLIQYSYLGLSVVLVVSLRYGFIE
ncbi:1982_t:CDS:2 [Ambispora gerdemannii]|uniref:1982_t:CDS:1 n=1 Tax=Ambispora gerdemannii TaxID=144530 RepID=A0A9N8YMW3_9GLOM|nr:1982_t:CDS:2 [Ambispora gerdemannii]